MKRILSVLIAAVLLLGCLAGCGSTEKQSGGKLKIVTTIFPEYDWVRSVLGDNPAGAELTMLLDRGVDLHSFQPSADDILKISACDLFIYVGGESDKWVANALKEAMNKNMVVINLLDALGSAVKEEQLVEGMQGEDEEQEEEEEPEYDEHVWLSLRNAVVLVNEIEKALETVDPDNAKTYQANAKAYTDKLGALDASYQAAVAEAPVSTLLFGDRFPFRYLADDYGLTYYAAFVGCSSETEASFETITFLAGKVDELALHAVMTIEGGDQKIAGTIVENTRSKDQTILALNSMQSVTSKDVENGATYLSIMESNLNVLKDALK